MELEVSNKQGGFGKKPHIKKGYYPAQLTKVEKFVDSDGKLREGQYGNQLILSFKVYKPGDNDEPTTEMKFIEKTDGEEKEPTEVIIPKFVYFTYKDQKSGEVKTAITPNSAITKTFKALGWVFDASKPLSPEEFIGNWVEININDFETKAKDGEKPYTASTINDINEYKGPAPTVGDKKKTSEELTKDALKEDISSLEQQVADGVITPDEYAEKVAKLTKK